MKGRPYDWLICDLHFSEGAPSVRLSSGYGKFNLGLIGQRVENGDLQLVSARGFAAVDWPLLAGVCLTRLKNARLSSIRTK
jgi:hypothetical protein